MIALVADKGRTELRINLPDTKDIEALHRNDFHINGLRFLNDIVDGLPGLEDLHLLARNCDHIEDFSVLGRIGELRELREVELDFTACDHAKDISWLLR